MQSASRRAFSALAAKIHPQLPLSPRESQQLLNLLTTSFRAHLDREHPVPLPEDTRNVLSKRRPSQPLQIAGPSTPSSNSSYRSASQHIDTILSNPLLARTPRRRGSDSAALDVIKDPVGWFLDQAAAGTADLPQAIMCLQILRQTGRQGAPNPQVETPKRYPGSVFVSWILSSGAETTEAFVQNALLSSSQNRMLDLLVPHLRAEDHQEILWKWLIEPPQGQTNQDPAHTMNFRKRLLAAMTHSTYANSGSLDEALAMFLRAEKMVRAKQHGLSTGVLVSARAGIVNRILTRPNARLYSADLYEEFLQSQSRLSNWKSQAVVSMLWLYHPNQATAQPGLDYIQRCSRDVTQKHHIDPQFIVQLCLGVARHLLAEEDYAGAQTAMDFVREHYPEMVISKNPSEASYKNDKREQESLDMLDNLLPA